VGGRKEILAISVEFSGDPPITYKLLINSYVSSVRKATQEAEKAGPAKAAAPAAQPAAPPVPEKTIEQIADEALVPEETPIGPDDPAGAGENKPSNG
jgi:hypothetical protein